MSSKSTIFLTVEGEHWYSDCNYEHDRDGKLITDYLVLEFLTKNAEIVHQNDDSFSVRVYPGNDLYRNVQRADENRSIILVELNYENNNEILCVINTEDELNGVLEKYAITTVDIINEEKWNFKTYRVSKINPTRNSISSGYFLYKKPMPETITIRYTHITSP